MVILVCGCDRNQDLFYPFHHCMEKYWQGHPEVIYSTESADNPFYKTISKDYPVNQWSRRIRETLAEIPDPSVIVMVDDVFIRKEVDRDRILYADKCLKGNVASINFEKAYDSTEDVGLEGFGKRKRGAMWTVSIMCGLWDRDKLMDVLSADMDPWTVEARQPTKGYDYLINTGDYIIDWGYRNFRYFGIHNGKWCREIIDFFKAEQLDIDLSKRGVA